MHAAAEKLGEFLREWETQPGPFDPALETVLELHEFLEDAGLVLGGDTDPRISHYETHAAENSIIGSGNIHLAGFGEFECVQDEVAQDLRALCLVGFQVWQSPWLLEYELDRVAC